MKQVFRRWLAVSLGLSCLGSGVVRAQEQNLPSTDRKIAPGDVLAVVVVGERDLPIEYRVSSPAGTIDFPFLGSVEVKDKTPTEVATKLKADLGKDYFVDPQVSVLVKEYRKTFVRVMGQVFKPGMVELPSEQRFDLLDALAAAGGLTNLANKDKIRHTRKGETKIYGLKGLREIKDPKQRVWLEPDDLIDVDASVF
jgi:polysaccharide export outer membrane protein